MPKKYRVFQFAHMQHMSGPDSVRISGYGDYRWKWTARLSMWLHSGKSHDRSITYTCERTDIAYLDPEPWVSVTDGGTTVKRYAKQPAAFRPPYDWTELKPRPQYYRNPLYYQEVERWQ